MKKIIYLILIAIILPIGCGEDFLDTKNLYQKSDESYYRTPEDIEEALAGAYAAVPNGAGRENPFIVAELLSDDCFGGGGTNDDGFDATDDYRVAEPDYYMDIFEQTWRGVFRVNVIIKRFDQAEYLLEVDRNQALGEAHFLRAYFYFRLSKYFDVMPLKLEPAPSNLPRATPEEMYSQIALDLKTAIEIMPSKPIQDIAIERLGHTTKWAAQALMARVYLFYTGFYLDDINAGMPCADGSTISKSQVIDWLENCIDNSGHGLLSDPRNNWDYTRVDRYPYTANHGLAWADGDDGLTVGGYLINKETVWAIKYSPYAGWNYPEQMSYSNQHSLYVGLRQQFYLPFGQGWGSGPVNPQLWDSFEEGDVRREGSILNVNILGNPDEGTIPENFIWGSDNQVDETGFWQKKYMPTYDSTGSSIEGIYNIYTEGAQTDFQRWNMQDDVLIRFADILLMAAELGSANAETYFNQIRERAGLDPTNPTLENIKLERRHELAFEGIRHYDLMRWHDMEAAHAIATNIPIFDVGEPTVYIDHYRPETRGFLPVPETEVILSEGLLTQTEGW